MNVILFELSTVTRFPFPVTLVPLPLLPPPDESAFRRKFGRTAIRARTTGRATRTAHQYFFGYLSVWGVTSRPPYLQKNLKVITTEQRSPNGTQLINSSQRFVLRAR